MSTPKSGYAKIRLPTAPTLQIHLNRKKISTLLHKIQSADYQLIISNNPSFRGSENQKSATNRPPIQEFPKENAPKPAYSIGFLEAPAKMAEIIETTGAPGGLSPGGSCGISAIYVAISYFTIDWKGAGTGVEKLRSLRVTGWMNSRVRAWRARRWMGDVRAP